MSIKIQKNISLSKYTSFKIGGAAKYFCVAENVDELKEALEFAEKNKLKVFVLGGGSNLLISDKGFDGVVIRIMNYELRIKDNRIFVGGGLSLAKLVSESVKNNLTDLEWSAGILGTVGGAVVNNAGANNNSMADVVEEVEILETTPPSPPLSGGELDSPPDKGGWGVKKLTNKQCQFSYRSSIFKKKKNILF